MEHESTLDILIIDIIIDIIDTQTIFVGRGGIIIYLWACRCTAIQISSLITFLISIKINKIKINHLYNDILHNNFSKFFQKYLENQQSVSRSKTNV